jgi:hypothetical protein
MALTGLTLLIDQTSRSAQQVGLRGAWATP